MTPRILPEEQDFDPDEFGAEEARAALARGLELFDAGRYHEAHEELERCWLAGHGADEGFYKGLLQAAICLHHFERGNLEGARKLHGGARRLLAPYLPAHRGIDLQRLLAELQGFLRPVLRAGPEAQVAFDREARPRIGPRAGQ